MPDAEVIVLMTRQRLLFLDAGADRAGAGVVLAPVRAQIQAGLAMRLLVRRIAEKLHGFAAEGIDHIQLYLHPNTIEGIDALAPVLEILDKG